MSVLVQDTTTGSAILDAQVFLSWISDRAPAASDWLPPCCSMETLLGKTPAVRTHSQNKLLYGAILPIRAAGPSELTIEIRAAGRTEKMTVPLEVAPARAPLLTYWPLLAFPPVAIGLFSLHQSLLRRKAAPANPL